METLARQSGHTVKNTSAHLRALRAVSLVHTRREGTYIHYRLADPAVLSLLRCVQDLAHRRLEEVRELVDGFFTDPEGFEPVAPFSRWKPPRSSGARVFVCVGLREDCRTGSGRG